jgi:hypothetical protein
VHVDRVDAQLACDVQRSFGLQRVPFRDDGP